MAVHGSNGHSDRASILAKSKVLKCGIQASMILMIEAPPPVEAAGHIDRKVYVALRQVCLDSPPGDCEATPQVPTTRSTESQIPAKEVNAKVSSQPAAFYTVLDAWPFISSGWSIRKALVS